MSTANITQSDQLDNHDLQKFIDKTTEILKLSMVQGFNSRMNPQVYKYNPSEFTYRGRNYSSVAHVASKRLKKFSPERKKSVRLALGRDASITSSIRTWGVDMRSKKSIIKQIDPKRVFSFVNESTFNETAMKRMITDVSLLATQTHEIAPIRETLEKDLKALEIKYGTSLPHTWTAWKVEMMESIAVLAPWEVNKKVKFRIHEVKCIDETNPEFWGSDEISWGGATADDKGVVDKIARKYVRGGFDDGDKKQYSPPEIIKTFSLDKDYSDLKEFMVIMALAEEDSGGMSAFIQELYEAIKAEIGLILTALGAAAGAAIGASIGGSIGTAAGGPIGTIIGVAAGAILGALIGWLISALQDDIFPPQAASLFLYKQNTTFPGGSLISPQKELHYRDHGGHYRITYDWEIVR